MWHFRHIPEHKNTKAIYVELIFFFLFPVELCDFFALTFTVCALELWVSKSLIWRGWEKWLFSAKFFYVCFNDHCFMLRSNPAEHLPKTDYWAENEVVWFGLVTITIKSSHLLMFLVHFSNHFLWAKKHLQVVQTRLSKVGLIII